MCYEFKFPFYIILLTLHVHYFSITTLPYKWDFCGLKLDQDFRYSINAVSYIFAYTAFMYWFVPYSSRHLRNLAGSRFVGNLWYIALVLLLSIAAQPFWPLFLLSTYFFTGSFYPWFTVIAVIYLNYFSLNSMFSFCRRKIYSIIAWVDCFQEEYSYFNARVSNLEAESTKSAVNSEISYTGENTYRNVRDPNLEMFTQSSPIDESMFTVRRVPNLNVFTQSSMSEESSYIGNSMAEIVRVQNVDAFTQTSINTESSSAGESTFLDARAPNLEVSTQLATNVGIYSADELVPARRETQPISSIDSEQEAKSSLRTSRKKKQYAPSREMEQREMERNGTTREMERVQLTQNFTYYTRSGLAYGRLK